MSLKATDWVFYWSDLVQLLTWLHVVDYHNFGTVKYSILKINSLPLNNCFSFRNVLQNGVNSLSKMVLKNSIFCPIAQTFVHFRSYNLVQISQVCGPNTYQIMYRATWDFQCQYLQLSHGRVLMANLLQKLIFR